MTPLWRRYQFRKPIEIEAYRRDDNDYDVCVSVNDAVKYFWSVDPFTFKRMFQRADSKPKGRKAK